MVSLVHGDVGVGQIPVLNLSHALLPIIRNSTIPQDNTEDSTRRGRVAVGVLTAAGGDIDSLVEVPFSVKESHDDVGAVDEGVDVGDAESAAGATDVEAPLALSESPCDLPVVGVLVVPTNHVRHALIILALCRNSLKSLCDNIFNVIRHKSEGIHRSHIDSAVPTVAVVHHVADVIREMNRRIDHSGSHDASIIRLYLEIDVIRMGIILPEAGFRRHDTITDVVARRLVGVPKRILR